MKYLVQSTLIFTILFVFNSCSEENTTERIYPRIETLDVTNITKNGVVLNGRITNDSNLEIYEYGFVWDEAGGILNPIIERAERVTVSEPIVSGEFSKGVQSGMISGRKYAVRSYLKSNDFLVYGDKYVFTSQGSLPTTIDKIVPDNGAKGDTITIHGKNFTLNSSRILIDFRGKLAKLVSNNESTMVCIVPEEVHGPSLIVLDIYMREMRLHKEFTINNPR